MSVKKEDIDFSKAFERSAGISKKEVPRTSQGPIQDNEFAKNFESSLKKKDGTIESTTPSDMPLGGDAGGTTSGTLKWEDNPLNPVKAINDAEANRDKTPEILFKDSDKQEVNNLLSKHNLPPTEPTYTSPFLNTNPTNGQPLFQQQTRTPSEIDYQNTVNLENDVRAKLENLKAVRQGQRGFKKSKSEEDLENDLQQIQALKRKAATELVVNGDKEVVVNSRTDDSGNSFKRTMQDLFGTKPGAWQTEKPQIEEKMKKMPTQFLTGMNMLRLTEPAEYERVQNALSEGLPISSSQTAKITALGLNIEEAKLQRDIIKSPVTNEERQKVNEVSGTLASIRETIDKYEGMIRGKQQLTPEQVQDYKTKVSQYNDLVTQNKVLIEKVNTVDGAFAKKAALLQKARMDNLLDNREVLRAFIADGVATKLDELGKIGQPTVNSEKNISDFMFGHTWNYTPEQIKWASEQYLKEQGLDPNSKQAQDAIKYLQDNEGVMIGENSIAKSGGFRELGEGLIEPITGISKSIDDLARPINDVYAESQSEGNVKVAKKRLVSEDTGVRSVVNDVLKGTGQFATQAAIMYATSGALGTIAEGIMGKSGVQLLANAKAANIKPVIAFDDATANIAAGKFLNDIKNPLSVFTTSYAMVYDNNLKAALSYTSDNSLAKKAAAFNSAMEGATELFLSPLEITEGIIHKFSKNQTKDILKILSDKSLKDDPGALKQYVEKFARGVLGTTKVATAEIGEELVTQISDYVTNMYLNPDSDSFKSRDLQRELMTTAYQTGLSMAVPALLNGIGASRANSFSKGSLMVAAQNRQSMVDDLNRDIISGRISQESANQQIQLINTAAQINAQLPKKVDGSELNTNDKASYIWSRTTESYMDKKMSSTNDAAEKEIWKDKILKQQEYRKELLGLKEQQDEAPEYMIDDKPVSREELLKTADEKPVDHTYSVTGDEYTQNVIRKIVGIDDIKKQSEENKVQIQTDAELIKQVEEKQIKNYEKPNIEELKEQALQAPDSFKNQFRDEDLTINLIAKNSEEQINNAIKYQQERLQDPRIDDAAITSIDKHIQLLEQGLQKNKDYAIQEQSTNEILPRQQEKTGKTGGEYSGVGQGQQGEEIANKSEEEKVGSHLSKLEQLKAKKLLAKEDVPGESMDEKLLHISKQPDDFSSQLVILANKRFPAEVKSGFNPTDLPDVETHESVMKRAKTGEPIEIDALRIQKSDKKNDDTGSFYGDKGVIEEYQRRQKSGYYGKENEELFKGDVKQDTLKFDNPLVINSKEEFVKELAENGDKEAQEVMPNYKENDPAKMETTHKTHKDFDVFIAKKAREKGYDGIITPLEYVDLKKQSSKPTDLLGNELPDNKPKVDKSIESGVDFVFKTAPQLLDIGTKEQYDEYIDSIFPESKVRDIVYHGTKNTFDKFDKNYQDATKIDTEGFHFIEQAASESYRKIFGKMIPVILDFRNSVTTEYSTDESSISYKLEFLKKADLAEFKKQGYDSGMILRPNENEYVAFDSQQIHILGSKKDLEGFKKWVSENSPAEIKNTTKSNLATELLDNIQTEINNGTITEQQAVDFINDTGKIEESNPIIEDIERNSESADTAAVAIEEGKKLIRGEDVVANRQNRAGNQVEKKQANQIGMPQIDVEEMSIPDLNILAKTTEANRQEYTAIKNQLYGLKNIVNCLWS